MRCIGEQQSKRDVPAPQINRLIVCIPKLKPDGLECDTPAWRVVQHVPAVLLVQDAAVSTSYADARQNAAATREAKAFIVCEGGAVQT